jgi:hypothetical protein
LQPGSPIERNVDREPGASQTHGDPVRQLFIVLDQRTSIATGPTGAIINEQR